MEFLRDHGRQVRCHNCRFIEIVDPKTSSHKETEGFGLSYLDNLRSLEGWSKEHDSHRAIFGGFIKYAAPAGCDCFSLSLALGLYNAMKLHSARTTFRACTGLSA